MNFVQDNESKSAHGFSVLTDEVIFQYKCDNFYVCKVKGLLHGMILDLGIDWRVPANEIVLSEKDNHHELLKDASGCLTIMKVYIK